MARCHIYLTLRNGIFGSCVIIVLVLLTRHKLGAILRKKDTQLIDLNSIDWPQLPRPNISTPEEVFELGPFDIKTSVGQQRSLEILLEEFSNAMAEANLDGHWFIQGGTLLGSIRHHDFVPWDDDADLHVDLNYREAVLAALKKRAPKILTFSRQEVDKIYLKTFEPNATITQHTIGSHQLSDYRWGWPYIELLFYRKIGPDLLEDQEQTTRKFKIKDLFPLTYRPLGKQWYPTPRRPISYLKIFYEKSTNTCISHNWSHAKEVFLKQKLESCRKLMEKYPFVSRCPIPKSEAVGNSSGLCDEYLVNGDGKVIHKIRLPLDADECDSPLFTFRHESFNCPL